MHERKKVMFMNADAIVTLPGGPGTLDELFEVLTWRQLGLHAKPVLLLNVAGYWDPLLALLENIVAQGFADAGFRGFFEAYDSVPALVAGLRERLARANRMSEGSRRPRGAPRTGRRGVTPAPVDQLGARGGVAGGRPAASSAADPDRRAPWAPESPAPARRCPPPVPRNRCSVRPASAASG